MQPLLELRDKVSDPLEFHIVVEQRIDAFVVELAVDDSELGASTKLVGKGGEQPQALLHPGIDAVEDGRVAHLHGMIVHALADGAGGDAMAIQ